MRIAQVSPLYESVPPQGYGGTERIVSYLTEELIRQGHEVTLFASGDSATSARLIASCPNGLRLDNSYRDKLAPHFAMVEEVISRLDEFDVVHWHVDYLHYPTSKRLDYPRVTTLHGRLDMPELVPLYRQYPAEPLVSISNNQRLPLPFANWAGTVYHGLPVGLHPAHEKPQGYLAAIGRISPEKRFDRAIEIARRLDMPLKIAAKIDKTDQEYFEAAIKPLLDHPRIEFVGEIGEDQKDDFIGNALALLFPIDWPEPFGLVMIEAMMEGTPVVGWRCGSVPEVIDDGRTGYVVASIDAAVAAVKRCEQLSRAEVRRVFEQRFSAERMARDYVQVYEQLGRKGDGWQSGQTAGG